MKKIIFAGLILAILCSCTARGNLLSADEKAVANQNASLSSYSNRKMCWGQGYNCNDQNQPLSCLDYNQKYGQHGAVFLSEKDSICLTFDEGYENGYTASILDTLGQKNVKAVFFVTYDYVSRNPELVRRMIDEGHVVGNHSWGHPSMPDLSAEQQAEQITKLHDYVKENFGYTMTLFRAPKGEFSEQSLEVTKSLGYTSVFWSFAYYDYNVNDQPTAQKAFDRVTKAAHNGAIYLLHAVSSTNDAILGDVIDELQGKGYTFSVKL